MDKKLKLLVLEEKNLSRDTGRRLGMARARLKNAIIASGAKVRHDSGGRFIVIEPSKETENYLKKHFPKAKLVALGTDFKGPETTLKLDDDETLFIEA
ncbi:MAG: hypothetical protein KDD04_05280, partial [Sinomicrobium sp.]|nr:hypothetical protein [Sinomicrobium sp.]